MFWVQSTTTQEHQPIQSTQIIISMTPAPLNCNKISLPIYSRENSFVSTARFPTELPIKSESNIKTLKLFSKANVDRMWTILYANFNLWPCSANKVLSLCCLFLIFRCALFAINTSSWSKLVCCRLAQTIDSRESCAYLKRISYVPLISLRFAPWKISAIVRSSHDKARGARFPAPDDGERRKL